MISKRHKQLKVVFILCAIFMIAVFIVDVLYVTKYVAPTENTGLERWAIIITMAGIVGALKFLHPRINDEERTDRDLAKRQYTKLYIMRLTSLFAIFLFNMISLNFTGSKNFVFLAFITIFAIFLCMPNLKYFETQVNGVEKDEEEQN